MKNVSKFQEIKYLSEDYAHLKFNAELAHFCKLWFGKLKPLFYATYVRPNINDPAEIRKFGQLWSNHEVKLYN